MAMPPAPKWAFSIAPSDTVNFTTRVRTLYVGGTGDVTVWHEDGAAPIKFVGVPQGTLLPIECLRVNATGTTATNLVGIV